MKPEETFDYHVRAVWYAIFRMYNQVGQQYGVTTSMGFVLLNIHSEEGTPATKIAPLMGLETRSLSRMLRSLEDKGLIYRVKDDVDRRSVRIFLTEEGKRKKEIARQTVRQFNEEVRQLIDPADMAAYFRVMNRVSEFINERSLKNSQHKSSHNSKMLKPI